MTIERSAFIDLVPSAKSSGVQLSQSDAPLTGVVSGVVDTELGLVEVQVDGSDEPAVVASADAGLTYVGAQVALPRDSSGRVTSVRAPTGVAPEGTELIPIGDQAVKTLATEQTVSGLDIRLAETEQMVDANRKDVNMKLTDLTSAMTAATHFAIGSRSVSTVNPTHEDADNKPEGAVWEVRSGDLVVRRYVLVSGAWVQVMDGADLIATGAIGARQILAEEIAAAVGRFLQISTDQLVAGSVQIANDLIATDIFGKNFTGSTFTMTTDNFGSIELKVDEGGRPVLSISDPAIGIVKFTNYGVTVTSDTFGLSGTYVSSWANFVLPPMSSATWTGSQTMATGKHVRATGMRQLTGQRISYSTDGNAIISQEGWYSITGRIKVYGVGAGNRFGTAITINNTVDLETESLIYGGGISSATLPIQVMKYLNAGDRVGMTYRNDGLTSALLNYMELNIQFVNVAKKN